MFPDRPEGRLPRSDSFLKSSRSPQYPANTYARCRPWTGKADEVERRRQVIVFHRDHFGFHPAQRGALQPRAIMRHWPDGCERLLGGEPERKISGMTKPAEAVLADALRLDLMPAPRWPLNFSRALTDLPIPMPKPHGPSKLKGVSPPSKPGPSSWSLGKT